MTEQEWLACTDSVAMLRFVRENASERKVRLSMCGGCRHVAHLFYRPASLIAVEVAERFADGLAGEEELAKAEHFAESVAFGFDFDENSVRHNPDKEAILAGLIEKGAVPASVLHGGEWRVDEAVASRVFAAANLAMWCAGSFREDERGLEYVPQVGWPGRWLFDCVFGDHFREVRAEPTWLAANDGVAPKLAQAIYEERLLPSGHLDNARLAVLADALEDAGCDDPVVLGHLRQQEAVHVRGCFVVDLLLGKE